MKRESYITMIETLDLSFDELEKLERKIKKKMNKGVGNMEDLHEYLMAVKHVSMTKALKYFK